MYCAFYPKSTGYQQTNHLVFAFEFQICASDSKFHLVQSFVSVERLRIKPEYHNVCRHPLSGLEPEIICERKYQVFQLTKQIAPVCELTLGCQILVMNLILGGSNGYSLLISMSTSKTPPS